MSTHALEGSLGALSARASLTGSDERPLFVLQLSPTANVIGDVLLIPPFGKTVHDLFIPAYYLCASGLRVTRFDARDHVGRSAGSIESFTLSGLERDTREVLKRIPAERPRVLLAMSLAAPVAWKVAGDIPDPASVVSLVGVVDVAATIESVSGSSVVPYRKRLPAPTHQKLFGYEVLAERFVSDMDQNGYGTYDATWANVRRVRGTVSFVVARDDEHVDTGKALALAESATGRGQCVLIEGSGHELGRSVRGMTDAISTATQLCLDACGGGARAARPPFTEVIRASGAESALLARFDAARNAMPEEVRS